MKKYLRKLFQNGIKKNEQQVFKAISALLNGENICFVDIGAADGIEPRWDKVAPVLHYIGFEPDERSDTENEMAGRRFAKSEIYRKAVWEHPQLLKINLAKKPQVSSYYTPNRSVVDLFPDPDRFNVVGFVELESVKLDDIELKSCDFMKLDIQGGEQSVLKGAEQLLKQNIGLEIEVEFIPVYNEQPLFGDIVECLKGQNYAFIDFVNLIRWERDAHSGYGQCVYGDALFLKSPETFINSDRNDIAGVSKYLSICLLYNRFDLIDTCMKLLSGEQTSQFTSFLTAIKPIRKKHFRVRRINALFSRLLKMVGGDDYKAHVIY